MQIVTLQTKDFKGLQDGIHDFAMVNLISGRNGTGKSSIADAIIFALFGRTRTGNASTDNLIREGCEHAIVAVEFDTGTTVLREQSQLYGERLKLNGEASTQADLNAALPDYKTFLSVFLPGYFMDQGESDARSQLLAYSKKVDLSNLFIEYTRKPELLDNYDFDFSNLDKEYKKYNKLEKQLKQEITFQKNKRTYAEEQITSLKKPKARIDVEKTQAQLELHESWDQYDSDVETNNRIGQDILEASKGVCSHCGNDLTADQKADRLKQLGAQRVEATAPDKKRPKTPAHELRAKLADAKATNALYDNYEEQVLDLRAQQQTATDEIERLEERAADYSAITEALSPKGIRATAARKQLAPIVETINEFAGESMPVKIETLKPLKNGELREVFALSVNKVPYKNLSTGERKRIDIALSQAIDKLSDSGIKMTFIDDAELISESFTISGQVFKAFVSNGDLEVSNAN